VNRGENAFLETKASKIAGLKWRPKLDSKSVEKQLVFPVP
jgi:hypothetical protein